jgi:hypothetical protein
LLLFFSGYFFDCGSYREFLFSKNHLKPLVFTLVLNEVIQVLEGVGEVIL